MSLLDLFVYVSQASVLLPVATGLVNYSKLTFPFRVLLVFFLLSIGFEILAYITRVIYGNNMPGLHLYTVVQMLALSTVYYHYFRERISRYFLVMVNAGIAVAIALADALYINGIMSSNTISRSYVSASVIIYSLIYFYQLFKQHVPEEKRYGPMFWFNVAVLVYFANNILYFMLRGYLLRYAKDIELFSYYVYLILNIVTYFLYAQSFRCFRKWKTGS